MPTSTESGRFSVAFAAVQAAQKPHQVAIFLFTLCLAIDNEDELNGANVEVLQGEDEARWHKDKATRGSLQCYDYALLLA